MPYKLGGFQYWDRVYPIPLTISNIPATTVAPPQLSNILDNHQYTTIVIILCIINIFGNSVHSMATQCSKWKQNEKSGVLCNISLGIDALKLLTTGATLFIFTVDFRELNELNNKVEACVMFTLLVPISFLVIPLLHFLQVYQLAWTSGLLCGKVQRICGLSNILTIIVRLWMFGLIIAFVSMLQVKEGDEIRLDKVYALMSVLVLFCSYCSTCVLVYQLDQVATSFKDSKKPSVWRTLSKRLFSSFFLFSSVFVFHSVVSSSRTGNDILNIAAFKSGVVSLPLLLFQIWDIVDLLLNGIYVEMTEVFPYRSKDDVGIHIWNTHLDKDRFIMV